MYYFVTTEITDYFVTTEIMEISSDNSSTGLCNNCEGNYTIIIICDLHNIILLEMLLILLSLNKIAILQGIATQ